MPKPNFQTPVVTSLICSGALFLFFIQACDQTLELPVKQKKERRTKDKSLRTKYTFVEYGPACLSHDRETLSNDPWKRRRRLKLIGSGTPHSFIHSRCTGSSIVQRQMMIDSDCLAHAPADTPAKRVLEKGANALIRLAVGHQRFLGNLYRGPIRLDCDSMADVWGLKAVAFIFM